MGVWRMRGFLFAPTWIRTLPAKLLGVRGAVAALGLMVVALTSPSHAQAPPSPLMTFGVLAGSSVTNTGPTTVWGNVGVSPGSSITGFSVGNGTAAGTFFPPSIADQAQAEDTTLYNFLAGRSITQPLTGTDLGSRTLGPGTYLY